MKISLATFAIFAPFATFGKSQAKYDGYLVRHKKGDITYVKATKGESANSLQNQQHEHEHEDGPDFRKESYWTDKWETAWRKIYSEAEREKRKRKRKPEFFNLFRRNRTEVETWSLLMDALRHKKEARRVEERMKNKNTRIKVYPAEEKPRSFSYPDEYNMQTLKRLGFIPDDGDDDGVYLT